MKTRCPVGSLFFILTTLSLSCHEAAAQGGLLDSIEDEITSIFDLSRLPNGTEVINSATEYVADGLGAYYSIPRSVINILRPGPLPYDLFLPTLSDFVDGFLSGGDDQGSPVVRRQIDGQDVQSNIQTIATNYVVWLVPVLVITILSLVLAICFPCAGLWFCCCRCCGKCGGKAYHYQAQYRTIKCFILSIIFLLSSIFLFVGIILGFLSNDKISSALDTYPGSVDAAIQDGVNYVDNTLDEVAFIATDQLDNVLDAVFSDVEGVATVLGNSLQAALEIAASPFLDSANTLLDNLNSLQSGFEDVDTRVNTLTNVVSQLNSSVADLQEALNNLSSLCGGDPTCLSLVPSTQQIELDFDANVLNVTAAISSLESADIDGVQEFVENTTQLISNISGILDKNLGSFELPVNRSQFDEVSSVVESIQDSVNEIIGENGTISAIRGEIVNNGSYYINLFDTYRYWLAAALFIAILLIWTTFVSGVFCGVFGYSRKALPYERSQVSHCGARLILFTTALSFLFGGLPLIPSSFLYFASTGMQKICNDLAPSEYVAFQRIFDDRQVWNGRTLIGSILHSQVGLDSNISLTEFFRECESNSPIYQALQVESFLDLEDLLSNLTNITDQLDFGDTDISSALNLSSSNIIPVSLRENLAYLEDNITSSVNLTDFKDYLSGDRVTFDIQDLSDNLTALATHFDTNMMGALANYTLDIRDNLVGTTINTTLQEFNQIQDMLLSNLTELNSGIQQIGTQVQSIFDNLDQFLNQTESIINNEVEAYINRILAYVTGFVDFALNAIQNEVGRCKPFSAAYTGLHITFCSETLDGVNGFWFSVGWCVVFLIPMLISGAILTNYIRRSPKDVHPITKRDDVGYVDTVISNTRVLSQTHHDPELPSLPNTPQGRIVDW